LNPSAFGLSTFLITAMTLGAQVFLTAHDKMKPIRGTHWIMTGHTGHHLAGALINHLVTHGMAELALGQMTARTDLVAVIPQHRKPIRAMHLMTVAAGIDIWVPMPTLGITVKGVLVAGLTHLVAGSLEHFLIIPGMGAVTHYTAVLRPSEHMIMRGHHGGFHSRMTTQAGIASDILLLPMTGIAFLFHIGLMQMLSNNPRACTAMGIMTGKTAADLAGKSTMPTTVLRLRMTGQTQGIGFHLQKLAVFRLMGLVTGIALALGKGFMGHGLGFCQIRMAGKAGFRQAFSEQPVMARGMGRMAAQTFTIPNRLVYHPLGKLGFRALMAGVTEFGSFTL